MAAAPNAIRTVAKRVDIVVWSDTVLFIDKVKITSLNREAVNLVQKL